MSSPDSRRSAENHTHDKAVLYPGYTQLRLKGINDLFSTANLRKLSTE